MKSNEMGIAAIAAEFELMRPGMGMIVMLGVGVLVAGTRQRLQEIGLTVGSTCRHVSETDEVFDYSIEFSGTMRGKAGKGRMHIRNALLEIVSMDRDAEVLVPDVRCLDDEYLSLRTEQVMETKLEALVAGCILEDGPEKEARMAALRQVTERLSIDRHSIS